MHLGYHGWYRAYNRQKHRIFGMGIVKDHGIGEVTPASGYTHKGLRLVCFLGVWPILTAAEVAGGPKGKEDPVVGFDPIEELKGGGPVGRGRAIRMEALLAEGDKVHMLHGFALSPKPVTG